MNQTNFMFFEEFKNLEQMCNDTYQSHNGITNYIDEMMTVSYGIYHKIPNWQDDLEQLRRLRHIRNNMAHEAGAFDAHICTQDDILWIRNFYDRILSQSDPLAILHQISNPHTNIKQKSSQLAQSYNSSTNTLAVFFILCATIFLILLIMFVFK